MAHPTLISDHVGTNPIITLERHAQHSHLTMWEHIPEPCQKGPALTSDNERNQSSHSMLERPSTYIESCEEPILPTCQKGSALTSDHVGTHPTVRSEWLCTYI